MEEYRPKLWKIVPKIQLIKHILKEKFFIHFQAHQCVPKCPTFLLTNG